MCDICLDYITSSLSTYRNEHITRSTVHLQYSRFLITSLRAHIVTIVTVRHIVKTTYILIFMSSDCQIRIIGTENEIILQKKVHMKCCD